MTATLAQTIKRDVCDETFGISDLISALTLHREHGALRGTMRVTNDENGDVTVERWAMSLRAMRATHPTWINRPYAIWRAEEHAFFNVQAWARMISEHPLGATNHQSRTWDWTSTMNGGRVQLRPSTLVSIDPLTLAPFWLWRNVGALDDQAGARHAPAKRTVPDGACHITFPDWVPPMTVGSPSTRERRTPIKRSDHVNAPTCATRRDVCKCGVTHHG